MQHPSQKLLRKPARQLERQSSGPVVAISLTHTDCGAFCGFEARHG